MTVSVMDMGSTNTTHSVGEYRYASELKSIVNPFMQFGERAGQPALFRNSDFLNESAGRAREDGRGVPLKHGNVAAFAFTIPSGYAKQVMPNLNTVRAAHASAQADTTAGAAAQGQPANAATDVAGAAKERAKEGVKEAAKDGAKQKAGKAIRGLFGRKP